MGKEATPLNFHVMQAHPPQPCPGFPLLPQSPLPCVSDPTCSPLPQDGLPPGEQSSGAGDRRLGQGVALPPAEDSELLITPCPLGDGGGPEGEPLELTPTPTRTPLMPSFQVCPLATTLLNSLLESLLYVTLRM